MNRLWHRATDDFHRDTGGQSMAFVALTGFLVCCFVILMLNNGRHLTHKVEAQNAVDAAVVSSATIQARGMNLIAVTNVMQAMLFAESIFVAAIWQAWLLTEAVIAANIACFCDPYCDLDLGRCWQSIKEEWNWIAVGIGLFSNGFPPMDDQIEYLWDRMQQLSDVAATIREGFESMAMMEANIIGKRNGLDYTFVWPNEMPIHEGEYTDLCETMFSGNSGGYEGLSFLWDIALVSAILAFSITEYTGEGVAAALVVYPWYANGPFGSPTQQAPFHMLMGEFAPLAKANAIWLTQILAIWGMECNPWFHIPYHDIYTDTGQSVPLILGNDDPHDGQYVGIGYDDPEDGMPLLLPDHFANPYNEMFGMITVAQAEVVNTHEASMFVPRWHARLVPVQKLGDMPLVIADYLYTTPGLTMPMPMVAGRIQLWVTTVSDLTQVVISH